MKNGPKMIFLGTISLGCGIFIGFKACKSIILSMLNDKKYMSSKILPILEKKIGKERFERMAKIYYDKEDDHGVTFKKRSEAEEVLTQLLSLMDDYKFVTVADLHDLIGETNTFKDNQLGWTDLKNAVIKRVYAGYLLDLPKAEFVQR